MAEQPAPPPAANEAEFVASPSAAMKIAVMSQTKLCGFADRLSRRRSSVISKESPGEQRTGFEGEVLWITGVAVSYSTAS